MAKRRSIRYVHRDGRGQLYVRIPYKKGDKWTAIERRVGSEDDALAKIQEIKSELGLNGSKAFDGDKLTFAELMDRYEIAFPDKPKWYVDPVREFFGARKIRSLTYGDCKQFKAARLAIPHTVTGEPRTIATINRELEILRAALRYAVGHGWLKFNPFNAGPPLIEKSKEAKRTRIPAIEEENRLIGACTGRRSHLRAIVIATLDTGLRKSALKSLTWDCVDWENRFLMIPPAIHKNKDRPPLCGISTRLHGELLAMHTARQPKPEEKIFGEAIDFKTAYASACEEAGIEGLRFNDLRHGYATKLMMAGVPQHLAMKMAGHSNPEIHGIYTNVDAQIAAQVREALDRFHAQREDGEVTESEKVQ